MQFNHLLNSQLSRKVWLPIFHLTEKRQERHDPWFFQDWELLPSPQPRAGTTGSALHHTRKDTPGRIQACKRSSAGLGTLLWAGTDVSETMSEAGRRAMAGCFGVVPSGQDAMLCYSASGMKQWLLEEAPWLGRRGGTARGRQFLLVVITMVGPSSLPRIYCCSRNPA